MVGRTLKSERGHLLLVVMIGVMMLLISMTVAVQAWSTVIKRDSEDELIFRGKQIAMAIKLYEQDTGAKPTELKQLEELGGPGRYYLRHPFKDPMVEDGEWGFVYLTPTGGQLTEAGVDINQQLAGGDVNAQTSGADRTPQEPTSVVGLPIMGVHSKSEEIAIGPNKWSGAPKYNEWMFTINDLRPSVAITPESVGPGTPGSPGQANPGGPNAGQGLTGN